MHVTLVLITFHVHRVLNQVSSDLISRAGDAIYLVLRDRGLACETKTHYHMLLEVHMRFASLCLPTVVLSVTFYLD